ncbi:MAG: molybdopterin-dependent oxidoreductase [Dehalococcoidia bacterium]
MASRATASDAQRAASERQYRDQIQWDRVHWGTHCVDCYPGNCPMRVFTRGGKVWREEQAGTFDVIEPGVPDFNPMGCQKGVAWSRTLNAPERVLHPLRRAGERGEGRWERISWDEATTEVADALIDAIEDQGPESIITLMGAEGGTWTGFGHNRLMQMLGGLITDVNAEINDFSPGIYETFGKFNLCSSLDDLFHAEVFLLFQTNPVYTITAAYHYIAEARYKGSEVYLFAPDVSPSHMHADYYLPTNSGTDSAWALGAAQVVVSEGLYDAAFVREQTDLPLLIRLDTRCYLRASDMAEGGLDDQFYVWDARAGEIAAAPRTTLDFGEVEPALEGRYRATLRDGSRVAVVPGFALMREHLDRHYTPEQASAICGIHADQIRDLGHKVARKRTLAFAGGTSLKYYHGDLTLRAVNLLLGLTANFGKKGTGVGCWSVGLFDGPTIAGAKERTGRRAARKVIRQHEQLLEMFKLLDDTRTDEMAGIEMAVTAARMGQVGMIPPAFFWYYHCGYRENWNKAAWHDAAMTRSFDEYLQEALDKGWWDGVVRPGPETEPRVLFQSGGNTLRRVRGGQNMLLTHLWPKLKKVVTLDYRMSTTACWSDIVLPVANQYERPAFHLPTPHMLLLIYSDEAQKPEGEAKTEYEIAQLIARKIEERARQREAREYVDSRGAARVFEGLYDRLTLDGAIARESDAVREMVADGTMTGSLPSDLTFSDLKRDGYVRFQDWGMSVLALNQAGDIEPDSTFATLTWHTRDKLPYPTLTRRAQYYFDHPWFLDAGEEWPAFKPNPKMGGDYPFFMTSGHGRWSIHSIQIANKLMLETHRGAPHMVMNTTDAMRRDIADDEEVRVFNDMGTFKVRVKVSPGVMPGQVVVYNGWDPYQFSGWRGPMDLEPGMVKWLHLAGGYGHLRYWPIQWQPTPVDRGVRVGVEKIAADEPASADAKPAPAANGRAAGRKVR